MGKNLITGGLGHLGCFLSRRLLELGEEVVIFDVATGARMIEDIKDRLKLIRGDITNWVDVFEAVKNNDIDCIYHAGGLLPPSSELNPSAAYMVNVTGTFHVLEVARLLNVGSIIFLSTLRTYDRPGIPPEITEDVLQMPVSMYGTTKVCGERLGEYYHRRFGVNFRGVRLPVAIGPGRAQPVYYTGWTWLVIRESAMGRPYTMNVDETAWMPVLYIKDAIDAMIGLKNATEAGLKRRMYNLHGFTLTAHEVADTVRKYLPQAQIDFRPDPVVMQVVHNLPKQMDITPALQDWGWKPKYDLDAMVKDFIAEVQANPEMYG